MVTCDGLIPCAAYEVLVGSIAKTKAITKIRFMNFIYKPPFCLDTSYRSDPFRLDNFDFHQGCRLKLYSFHRHQVLLQRHDYLKFLRHHRYLLRSTTVDHQ